jgi:Spy/CpxP family protein refolding chaperone
LSEIKTCRNGASKLAEGMVPFDQETDMRKILLGAALAMASAVAGAQGGPGTGYGPGYGPGMMGGGYGPGPGMMGGGRGPGMMGGWGPGNGASFGATAPLAALNLTDEQQEKIFAIQEQNRQKNWDTMGRMRAEQFKLRRLYGAENIDPNAFAEQQKKVDDLRREMLVSRLQTRNQIHSVLTPEQRKQMRQFGPWWAQEEEQ